MNFNHLVIAALMGATVVSHAETEKKNEQASPATEPKAIKEVRLDAKAEEKQAWIEDIDVAKAKARSEKKDMILDFTGSDWCGWCVRLRKEVFDQPEFLAGVEGKFVLAELDFPQKKQLPEGLKAKNEAIAKALKIGGFPTILICDSEGVPYAKTGYQPGGAAKYLAHIEELQAIKAKRDEQFAASAKATTDEEKAKCLIQGLNEIDPELVDTAYGHIIDQIKKLDPEDKLAYVKAKEEKIAKAAEEEQMMEKMSNFMQANIRPLMEKKEYAKAVEVSKQFYKENPGYPVDAEVGTVLNISLAEHLQNNDLEKAMKVVDELSAQYPESQLAKNIDKVRESLTSHMSKKKAVQEKAAVKEAPAKEGSEKEAEKSE